MRISSNSLMARLQSRDISRQGIWRYPYRPIREETLRTWVNGILLLGSVVLLIWVIWLLSQPGTLPIKHVRITGDFRYLQPERLQALVRDEVRGGFFNVNVATIRDILMQDAWIEDVVIQRVWPGTLQVVVTEHIPLARWGKDKLFSTQGKIFTPDKLTTVLSQLPLLLGPTGSGQLLFQRFREINRRLEPLGLSVIQLEQDLRRSWHFIVDTGFGVVIGRKDFSQRVNRFVTVVMRVISERVQQVDVVDMRYTNGFSVRWKQPNPE